MDTFIEGELAVLQHATYFQEWDGSLAVVVGPLMPRMPRNMHSLKLEPLLAYQVRPLISGAFLVNCAPYQLRKLDRLRDAEALEILSDQGVVAEHAG